MTVHEPALQRLLDEAEIRRLLTTYCTAVDDRDWDLYRTVFTPDAFIDYTSTPHGQAGTLDETVAWLSENLTLLPMTMHYVLNVDARIDGDTAIVRAQFYNPLQIPGVERVSFCGGYYNHSLVRTADGWRSERLVEDNVWFDNNPFV
ncbi:nuclear transport factor 2 family protein [Gordonia sp. X0973]|uniref:nuclear transport factor 2 family protein n=1 Tax=Gordonia sp. X0973 TaxID=2742602 RepID=UPI000F53118F|nr:nuclear transport factor 2 family protein [Gordonia sp. X0973]QKT08749.1 nuclear transport factor 2 family protein [Gordonia sp. X0973]